MSDWRYVFVCEKCQHVNLYWNSIVCPKCGDKKKIYYNPSAQFGWDAKIARVVSKSIWYKPFTWFRYEWEFRPDNE